MVTTSSTDLLIKSIKTKKFSSGQLSREVSTKSSGSEYYADASVAVPFTWESEPGTPKVKYCEISLPPLTPPPSYQSSTAKKHMKKNTKSILLHIVLPKLSFRKDHSPQISTPASPLRWSPSSSSPSSSSFSAPPSPYNHKYSSPASPIQSRVDDRDDLEPPVSALCFSIGRRSNARSCGFSSNTIKIMHGELA